MLMNGFGDEWGRKIEELWDVGGRLEARVWAIFVIFRSCSLFLLFATFGTVCSVVARHIEADGASIRVQNQRRAAAAHHAAQLARAAGDALRGVPRSYRPLLQALEGHDEVQEIVEEMPGFQTEGLAFILASGGKGWVSARDIRHAIEKLVRQESAPTTAQLFSALAILEGEHKSSEAAGIFFRDEARVEQEEMKEDLREEFMHVTEMVRALVADKSLQEDPKRARAGGGRGDEAAAAPLSDLVPPLGGDETEESDYKSRYGRMYIEMLKHRRDAQAARAEASRSARLVEKLQRALPAVSMAAKLQSRRAAAQGERSNSVPK